MHFNASFCNIHGIDNSLTVYQWEIVYNRSSFVPMVYSTFFASPHTQILDEFYLLPGSKVRCKATAVDVTGVAGYKRPSQALEIPEENQTQCSNSIGEFTAEFHPSSPFTGQSQVSHCYYYYYNNRYKRLGLLMYYLVNITSIASWQWNSNYVKPDSKTV